MRQVSSLVSHYLRQDEVKVKLYIAPVKPAPAGDGVFSGEAHQPFVYVRYVPTVTLNILSVSFTMVTKTFVRNDFCIPLFR